MTTPIKISFVIPVYNAERWIERCVKSILQQDISEIEIILVDDGSNDNSLAVCKDMTEQHECVKFIHQENSGVTKARKTGVESACGEWICFVDADDTLPQNVMGKFYKAANESACDIAVSSYRYVYSDSSRRGFISLRGKVAIDDYINSLFAGTTTSGVLGRMIKRSLLIETRALDVPANITNSEDLIMNLKLALKSKGVIVLPLLCAYNYHRDTGETVSRKPLPVSYWEMLYETVRDFIPNGFNIGLLEYMSNIMVSFATRFNLDFRNSICYKDLIAQRNRYNPFGMYRANIAYLNNPTKCNRLQLKFHRILRGVNQISHYVYYKLISFFT